MAINGFDDDQTRSFTALAAGTKVSHYKIISKIGVGGMGEVYLAEDTQLDRKVALKFLPFHLSRDGAARARFTREAKAAAKLDHPNIVPVYEVGEFQGRPFFAMAHIKGKSLREVIKEGRLSIEEAIEFTRQICEGLQKAHESGVVHRDIKPGNIIIDVDNKARILDFGLATVAGEDKLTRTGSTLGTVGYMSPEQITGKAVDHRSDLFSVGVILYEMLTGRRPFQGENDAAIARAITDSSPEPIARFKSGVSGEIQQTIDKCLSKDPSLRYQNASDVIVDLNRLQLGRTGSGVAPGKKRSGIKLLATAIVICLLVVITLVIAYKTYNPAEQSLNIKRVKITTTGDARNCKPSPSNNEIAFISDEGMSDSRLMVQDLNSSSVIEVFRDMEIVDFAWSPDGSQLIVASGKATGPAGNTVGYSTVISRVGENIRTFPYFGFRISWSPDGSAVAYIGLSNIITILQVKTGDTSSIGGFENFDRIADVHWFKDSQHLLISEVREYGARILAIDMKGKTLGVLADSLLNVLFEVSPDNTWLYMTHLTTGTPDLYRIKINPTTYKRAAEPEMIASGLSTGEAVSLSRNGDRIYYSLSSRSSNIWKVTMSGPSKSLTTSQITRGSQEREYLSVSPDRKSILFGMGDQSKDSINIFTLRTDGSNLQRITFSGLYNRQPEWSPTGDEIVFINWDNSPHLVMTKLNGSVTMRLPVDSLGEGLSALEWNPGRLIAYIFDSNSKVGLFDPSTHTARTLFAGEKSVDFFWVLEFSPDGQTLALAQSRHLPGDDSGSPIERHVCLLNVKTGKLVSITNETTTASRPLGWSSDGRYVICGVMKAGANRPYVEKISIDGKVHESLFEVPWEKANSGAIVDDTTFVIVVEEGLSDIWALEGIGNSK